MSFPAEASFMADQQKVGPCRRHSAWHFCVVRVLLLVMGAGSITWAADVPWSVRVNFQNVGIPVPAGYVADVGYIFDVREPGLRFGWSADNTENTRYRGRASDPRLTTLTHLQLGVGADRFWEIEVPDGVYTVTLYVGDPCNFDSVHRLQVEGVAAITGFPSLAEPWFVGTVVVPVADGRLTIACAPGAQNAKLCAVDILAGEQQVPAWEFTEALRTDAVELTVRKWLRLGRIKEARAALEDGYALLRNPGIREQLAADIQALDVDDAKVAQGMPARGSVTTVHARDSEGFEESACGRAMIRSLIKDRWTSSGELVLLQAMAAGRWQEDGYAHGERTANSAEEGRLVAELRCLASQLAEDRVATGRTHERAVMEAVTRALQRQRAEAIP
jgi:hypothetical protein